MNFTLNPGQEFVVRAAVDWFLNSDEQLFQYDGPPGSGKSVVLNEIVKIGRFEFKIIKNTMTKIELVRLKVVE